MLETDRLRLRQFVLGDAPFIRRLLNEPGFLRFIGDRGVRTDDDARAYVERVPLESYRRPAGAELELHSNGGRTHLPPP